MPVKIKSLLLLLLITVPFQQSLAQKSFRKKLDPEKYICRKINQNFRLDDYINDINVKYDQLRSTVHNNISFYNDQDVTLLDNFYSSYPINQNLDFLQTDGKYKRYPNNILLNNQVFDLYLEEDFLVAASEKKIPVDSELERIIATANWSSKTQTINSEYINNLKSFAKINSELYGYMIMFYDGCLKIFKKIDDIGYGSINAENLIGKYSRSLGYDFSIFDYKSSFYTYRDDLKEMQDLSDRIYKSCNTFLTLKNDLEYSTQLDYLKVSTSLKGFSTISDELNTLADQVEQQKLAIAENKENLQRLSNFYGISFLESIGGLYQHLEDYYQLIEDGVRQHADNFSGFVDDINNTSNQYYLQSKSQLIHIGEKQIADELPHRQDYIDICNDIANHPFKVIQGDLYIAYLEHINTLNNELNIALEIDFVQLHYIKNQLIEAYNKFPVKDARNYYFRILTKIDKKQILGGKNHEKYYANFEKYSLNTQSEKSGIQQLLKASIDLNNHYNQAIKNNKTLFIILGLISAIFLSVILIRGFN